jgi:GT2 family glycosyltransferase
MAQGDFIAFLDHDDALAPHALAEIVAVVRENPNAAMIYTDHMMMDDDGRLHSPALKPAWSQEFFLSTNYVVHFKVIRRSIVLELDGFKDALDSAQDIALTCKIAERGLEVRHLPKVLYYWRIHPLSVSSRSSAKPAIEFSAIQTYNDSLANRAVAAKVVWPDPFRRARLGVYKLEFPNTTDRKLAVILPAMSHPFDAQSFAKHFPRTDFSPLPPVYLITTEEVQYPGIHCRSARTQKSFDEIVNAIDADHLVFVSPSAKLVSPAWLCELAGYLSVSPRIGAVGGKILDAAFRVQSGGLLLLNEVVPICAGNPDEANGYWFNNRVASNVEAVSARLMATSAALYREMGGIPFFEYRDAAGVPFCLKLRDAGYRVVYTPWSKIVDSEAESAPDNFGPMLERRFGLAAKYDRYYHPFFSKDVPYTVDARSA